MSIDNLRSALPDWAKDLSLNLSTLSRSSSLTEQQQWGTFVAAAAATRNESVLVQVMEGGADSSSPHPKRTRSSRVRRAPPPSNRGTCSRTLIRLRQGLMASPDLVRGGGGARPGRIGRARMTGVTPAGRDSFRHLPSEGLSRARAQDPRPRRHRRSPAGSGSRGRDWPASPQRH